MPATYGIGGAIAAAMLFLQRFGEAGDGSMMVTIATEQEEVPLEVRTAATELELRLCDDVGIASQLLETSQLSVIETELRVALEQSAPNIAEQGTAFLNGTHESFRPSAIAYLGLSRNSEDRDALLRTYMSADTYYCNVVKELDEPVFVPKWLLDSLRERR